MRTGDLLTLAWSGVGGRCRAGVREGLMVGHCLVLIAGRLLRLLSRGDGDLVRGIYAVQIQTIFLCTLP